VDRTRHYQTLDGLRGVAALSVFAFHLLELVFLKPGENPLPRAYLAVDFFFCLSGFVIGHAYDGRLGPAAPPERRLGFGGYVARRLIRLQPLVVIGALLGAVGYLANPFVGDAQQLGANVGYGLFAANLLLALFLIPAPALPNMWGMTHSLNGPAWSLFQEYLINFAYAAVGHRIGRGWLAAIAAIAVAGLLWMALSLDSMNAGAAWRDWWGAPIRVIASFTLGLLIHRLGLKIAVPAAFPLLSAVLIALFAVPLVKGWSGLIDWLCVVVAFPLTIMIGAGDRSTNRLARIGGRLSYPLYMVHYSFVLFFAHWNWSAKPGAVLMWGMMAVTIVATIGFAWAVLVWTDEPIRAWLSARMERRRSVGSVPVE
jgi:peptidoglycan/LPS O-acetylase OafA/YrhL